MKKFLKFVKTVSLFILMVLTLSGCAETEEERFEREYQERYDEYRKECLVFPSGIDSVQFIWFKYYRNDWGPDNQTNIIKLDLKDYSEENFFKLGFTEDLDYSLHFKSEFVNQVDSTIFLDFKDEGKFTYQESNFEFDDWSGFYRTVHYQFNSSVDDFSSEILTHHGLCHSVSVKYSRMINERDSISVLFSIIKKY